MMRVLVVAAHGVLFTVLAANHVIAQTEGDAAPLHAIAEPEGEAAAPRSRTNPDLPRQTIDATASIFQGVENLGAISRSTGIPSGQFSSASVQVAYTRRSPRSLWQTHASTADRYFPVQRAP